MTKLLASLLLAVGAVTAQAQSFMSLPPAEGLPICSAAFGALAHYSKPETKSTLLDYSTQVAAVSKRYNPTGPNDALNLAREMYYRAQNESGYMQTLKTTARNCQQYVAQYGVR